jgi:hypothetical protein
MTRNQMITAYSGYLVTGYPNTFECDGYINVFFMSLWQIASCIYDP